LTNQTPSLSIEKGRSRFNYGYIIVLLSFFLLFIAGGTLYSFGVFFKPVLTEFGWSRAATAGAYSLNMILSGVAGIVAGRLCDRLGPRPVVIAGGILMGSGFLLMSQVNAIWQIYVFFGVLASLGLNCIVLPSVSSTARWFSKRRGLASGIVMAGSGVGTASVPPLANYLIIHYSWRTSYILIGSATLILVILFALFLKRVPSQEKITVQEASAETKGPDLQTQGYSFRQAIQSWTFWIICVIGLFFGFGQQTIMVHIVAHATDINIAAATAATILTVIGSISIVGKLSLGSLSDKMGNKLIFVMIFTFISAAFIWLLFADKLWMIYVFAAVFAIGYGGMITVQSPLIAEYFGLRSHGVILGLTMLTVSSGGALGSLVAGRIFDISGSYQLAFIICGILGVTNIILSISLKSSYKVRQK
jgi:MFS family permease